MLGEGSEGQMRGTNSGVVQEMPSACPAPPGTGLGSHWEVNRLFHSPFISRKWKASWVKAEASDLLGVLVQGVMSVPLGDAASGGGAASDWASFAAEWGLNCNCEFLTSDISRHTSNRPCMQLHKSWLTRLHGVPAAMPIRHSLHYCIFDSFEISLPRVCLLFKHPQNIHF